MATIAPPVTKPTVTRGISRLWPIPACSLAVSDLRRLFAVLEPKAAEAAAEQLQQFHKLPTQTDEQFSALQNEIRGLMSLVVRIQGGNGEWSAATSIDAINEDSLPAVLTQIVYECGPLYRARFNLFAQNHFSVTLDFRRTHLADLTNLATDTGLGPSFVNIQGVNITWVNAVDNEIRTFFRERATRRTWLHSRFAYDIGLFLVGIPLCLDGIYHLDQRLAPIVKLPQAIFVALYVYLALVGLWTFRILFNYAKWVFPKIEAQTQRRGAAAIHKMVIGAIMITLATRVVTTTLWLLGIHLH
jgi:hypothetical protein